jgi:uncharacterized protein
VLAPVTVVLTFGYLLFLLVTAGKVTGPVLLGAPVAWRVAQLLAVATTVAAVAVAVSLRRPENRRARTGVLAASGVLFVPWAMYWGLLWV